MQLMYSIAPANMAGETKNEKKLLLPDDENMKQSYN